MKILIFILLSNIALAQTPLMLEVMYSRVPVDPAYVGMSYKTKVLIIVDGYDMIVVTPNEELPLKYIETKDKFRLYKNILTDQMYAVRKYNDQDYRFILCISPIKPYKNPQIFSIIIKSL